jgi:hypothetical protein
VLETRNNTKEGKAMVTRKRVSKEEVRENASIGLGGLENSAVFDPDLRIPPQRINEFKSFLNYLADELELPTGQKRRPQNLRSLETLICNLTTTRAKDRLRYLSLSLSPNSYGKNGEFAPLTSSLKDIVKELEKRGYLFLHKGFQNEFISRLSRSKGRDKFYQLLETQTTTGNFPSHNRPDELIRLRKTIPKRKNKKKKKIDIPRHEWKRDISKEQYKELEQAGELCQSFNDQISYSEIYYTDTDSEIKTLYPILYRVFSGDFIHGGRYFCGVGGHQNLPKDERATIIIDNEPTVELDYGGLHLRMLYHLNGKEFPFNQDPYVTVLEAIDYPVELGDDGKPTDPEIRLLRDDMKEMLLAIINDKCNHKQAIARAERRLFRSYQTKTEEEAIERLKAECRARKQRWNRLGITVEEILQGFYKAHEPIKDKFFSGCGLKLQYLDSELATIVLFCLKLFRSPCLPVHDSFIVPKSKKELLSCVMELAYNAIIQSQPGPKTDRYRIPIG